jgi:hypothetical protein
MAINDTIAIKNRFGFSILFLLGFVIGLLLVVNDVRAQQDKPESEKAKQVAIKSDETEVAEAKVAPKAKVEPKAQAQADTPYIIRSSIEFGVRGLAIEGNADKYRSDLNYTPGFRIFDSSLMLKSRNGDGMLFDDLLVSSFGWGEDPNRLLRINAAKTEWYKFDANYRRVKDFNSLRNLALNQHITNTEYRQGDFDLTLLPANDRIRFNLGYSLSRISGPSLFTWDYARDEFPVLSPTRVTADDFRVGADAKLWVFDLSFQQGWRFFKEDTRYFIDNPQVGNNPLNTSRLTTFNRDVPTRGKTPFTRLSAHTLIANKFDFTGRFIYSNSESDFTLFENITGVDGSNNNIKLDLTRIDGNTRRTTRQVELGVTYFATRWLRLSNTFRANSFDLSGGHLLDEDLLRTRNTLFGETPLPPVFTNTLVFRDMSYRRYANLVEGDFDITRRFSAHLGYRFSDRQIEFTNTTINLNSPTPVVPGEPHTIDTNADVFLFGFKAKPIKAWTVFFDVETGENDNVFTRVAPYDYTYIRLRNVWRPTKTLSINASLVTRDNTNPSTLEEDINSQRFGADSNTRIFTSSFDWTPSTRFSISSGYTYQRITSDVDIIFFSSGVRQTGLSRYFMRDNFVFVNTAVEFHPRVKLYASYRIHNDKGQDDRVTEPTILIGSFPYQFQSPEARLAVKLHRMVDWVVGYQYFDYKDRFAQSQFSPEFGNNQFYQAHLPYTSLKIYFGRPE